MSTFVAVGNSKNPFPRLLQAVEELASRGVLPQPVVVQHGHTPFRPVHCAARDFLAMQEFDEYITHADLVILQAGGGSVLTAKQSGKIPVLLPRRAALGEVVDDHQLENARNLEALGGVVVAWETDDLAACVAEALSRQQQAVIRRDAPAVVAMVAEDLRAIAARAAAR